MNEIWNKQNTKMKMICANEAGILKYEGLLYFLLFEEVIFC